MTKYKILNVIRFYGPISRVAIAAKLEISNTAVTKYVAELIAANIIIETGVAKSSGGRKPALLQLNTDYGWIIGLDFGQHRCRAGLFNLQNECLYRETVPAASLGRAAEGIPKIIAMIQSLQSKIKSTRLLAVGIAVSGITGGTNEACMTIPNLDGWKCVDFREPFEKEFHVPIFVEDSPRMTALCESIIPAHGRYKNLIYINIGVGVGAGIMVFGRLLRGSHGLAGEFGHLIVEEDGLVCGCGNRGCLEQYASVPAMIKNAQDKLERGVRSSILDYAGGVIRNVDSYALAQALAEHDKLAFGIMMEVGCYLGKGISQIINLFNPERIIIGGGGANISAEILDEIVKTCHIRALNEAVRQVQINRTDKGEDSALIGIATFVQDNLFGLTKIQESSLF